MKFALLALITFAVIAGLLVCLRRFRIEQPPPIVVASQGPTIERLERLSQLVCSRIVIADVLTAEGNGCKGAWLIRGDALIATDLSKAVIVDRDETTKQATIRLPPPVVLQGRVDHSRTKTWQVRTTTFIPWTSEPDQLRDNVMREAQELVTHAASSRDNIQQAKLNAETIIRSFYAEVGWNVRVNWAEGQEVAPPVR